MKLFEWVHRKFRQNSLEPFKGFTFGNTCICLSVQLATEHQHSHGKPSLSSGNICNLKQHQQESDKSYSEFEEKGEEINSQEEASAVISELFHGFLTIGTLGGEIINDEPATPTFAIPSKMITKQQAEFTENDLKLINYELEKFVEAENKDGYYESSGRNSHASTITLSGKEMDEAEDEYIGNTAVFPLQGYLLGSSVELPETRIKITKEKASLAELFQRTEINEKSIEIEGTEEKQVNKTSKSAVHLLRKMLKKVRASSRCSAFSTADDRANSVSPNKKLHKVLRMIHRKIYPESSIIARGCIKSHKDEMKTVSYDGCHVYDSGDLMHPDESSRKFYPGSMTKKWNKCHKTNLNTPQLGLSSSSSSGNKGQWIKTDADYLVLEL
ncbi:Protein LAZY 1 [Quillaja saponaria]|uniref:Protein LAZY 1 n=1 Tax=Quillaja saponaria TaxID=32244 RepID=A0AAD7VDK6_QUISA|nr:Protein LAZY 1 [Quillaja saponaria]